MKRWQKAILGLAALATAGYFSVGIANAIYFAPAKELRESIKSKKTVLTQFDAAASAHETMVDRLQDIADQTFGPNRESVESALRARLNRIAEEIGLDGVVVTSGQPSLKGSPARRDMNRRNPHRDEPDFAELDASLNANATVEQAVKLVDRIAAEPWKKRINSVVLDPNELGERVKLTVRLTTMYLPGMSPRDPAALAEYDDSSLQEHLAFAQMNPFALPKPEPPPVEVAEAPKDPKPTPPEAPPVPPAPKHDLWKITMVTQGSSGWQVWLLNTKNGQTRTLKLGDQLAGMKLFDASPDTAAFEWKDKQFEIQVGEKLSDRTRMATE